MKPLLLTFTAELGLNLHRSTFARAQYASLLHGHRPLPRAITSQRLRSRMRIHSKGCGAMRTRKKVLANARLLTAPRRIFGLSITFNVRGLPGIAARL